MITAQRSLAGWRTPVIAISSSFQNAVQWNLLPWEGAEISSEFKEALYEAARHENLLHDVREEFARKHQCYILAGSTPWF